MERAIVTGATGMIGQNLIEYLVDHNVEVLAIVNPESTRISQLTSNEFVIIQKCDLAQLDSIVVEKEYNYFFHLGWGGTFGKGRDELESQVDNITYTLSAVRLAKRAGCSVFVGVGSQAEYGIPGEVDLNDQILTNPITGYGIAKLSAGMMSRRYCEQYGIRHVWTRILSVYGPGDRSKTMIMSTIDSAQKGENPKCTLGEQVWDYLYVKDAVKALYLMALFGKNKKVYCLGSGTKQRLKDYIYEICRQVNDKVIPQLGEIPYGPHPVMYLCADISDLEKDVGFLPEYSFEEGIRETIEWVKENRTYEEN